jgi:hypothetical protein
MLYSRTFNLRNLGVTEVQADVDTKLVNVTCEDSVDADLLLSALKNWGEKAGKTVERLEE